MGVGVNGHIRCAYHGMEFDGTGRCVQIPAQFLNSPKARCRNFPVIERYGLISVWMGDPALANPARLPKVEKCGEPGWDVIDGGYQYHPSNVLNIIENLMNPSHTTFLHPNTIGNPLSSETPVTTEKNEYIVAYRWLDNTRPFPNDRRRVEFGDGNADRGQFFYFYLPAMSRVEIIVMPAGTERTEENTCKWLRTYSCKFLTPETGSTTLFSGFMFAITWWAARAPQRN